MTKTEIYTLILENLDNLTLTEDQKSEISARMEKDIELASKKSTGEKKPTAKQIANDGIREQIVALLGQSESPMKIADICAELGEEVTHNQVVALLNGLVKSGAIVKSYDKKVAQYAIAEGEEA